jgi:hypothetical protein
MLWKYIFVDRSKFQSNRSEAFGYITTVMLVKNIEVGEKRIVEVSRSPPQAQEKYQKMLQTFLKMGHEMVFENDLMDLDIEMKIAHQVFTETWEQGGWTAEYLEEFREFWWQRQMIWDLQMSSPRFAKWRKDEHAAEFHGSVEGSRG